MCVVGHAALTMRLLVCDSTCRFLVDVRGGDATQKQLRDDLITLLIAGHETTGSMLTWATWLLAQYPEAQVR